MMKYFVFTIISLFQISAFSQSDISSKIANNYKSTKSIQADFKQRKTSVMFKEPIVKSGKFFFEGDNIKWMIQKPNPTTILITKEFTKQKIGSNAPENLKGFTFIKKFMQGLMKGDFLNSKKFKTTSSDVDGNYILVAKPLDARIKKYISSFTLTFSKSSLNLVKMELLETSMDRTVYIFSNQKKNQPIPSQTFETFH